MEQLLNPSTWRELGALSAVLLAFVSSLFLLYRMLLALLAFWREGRQMAHAEETERLKTEQDQTKALTTISERLKEEQTLRELQRDAVVSLSRTVADLALVVSDLKKEMGVVKATMTTVTEQRAAKLDLMHQDIKAVPSEVWRQGDPKLAAIRQLLETYLAGMEQRIIERIDPAAENARQAVSDELQRLRGQFDEQLGLLFRRLDGIDGALTLLSTRKRDVIE